MRKDPETRIGVISRRDVTWWIASSCVGVDLFSFPRFLVLHSGLGAVYSFTGEMFLVAVSTWLVLAFMQRNPGRTTVQIAIDAMGWPGRIFAFLMGLIMLLTLAESYRFLADVMRETSLQRTPLWAITLMTAAAVAYISALGLVPVSRTLQVVSPFLLAAGVGIFLLTLGGVRTYFLIPHWTGWQPIMAGGYTQFFIFAGLQNVHIFHAFVGRARVGRAMALGLALNAAILFFILAGSVGTFGVDALKHVTWPNPFLERSVSVHGFYVRRIGFFSFLAGVGWVTMFLSVTTLLTSIGFSQVLGMRPAGYRSVLPFVVLLPVTVALFIPDEPTAQVIATRWLSPLTLFMLLGEPILLWGAEILFGRRRRGRAPHAAV